MDTLVNPGSHLRPPFPTTPSERPPLTQPLHTHTPAAPAVFRGIQILGDKHVGVCPVVVGAGQVGACQQEVIIDAEKMQDLLQIRGVGPGDQEPAQSRIRVQVGRGQDKKNGEKRFGLEFLPDLSRPP